MLDWVQELVEFKPSPEPSCHLSNGTRCAAETSHSWNTQLQYFYSLGWFPSHLLGHESKAQRPCMIPVKQFHRFFLLPHRLFSKAATVKVQIRRPLHFPVFLVTFYHLASFIVPNHIRDLIPYLLGIKTVKFVKVQVLKRCLEELWIFKHMNAVPGV